MSLSNQVARDENLHESLTMSNKTVVELDLVGYSDLSRTLEENVGVEVVARLNEQIHQFVETSLARIGVGREQVMLLAKTGDGAILAFDNPDDAHRFAAGVHEAAQGHNSTRDAASAQRWFRIGAATGRLYHQRKTSGKEEVAGTVISNAVRLEAASRPGQIVIDDNTFNSLSGEFQTCYGQEEIVAGKRMELFKARRCTVLTFAQNQRATVSSILDLFDRLIPRDQMDRLMLIIGMPPEHRPSRELTIFRRQDQIVDWAQSQGASGIEKLSVALNDLIRKQSPLR